MKDDNDKKEELKSETVWATMHKAGGPITWAAILLSFFVTEVFSKWGEYQLQSISTVSTDAAETGDSST